MNRLLFLIIAAAAVVGCSSLPFSPFVSPRVTGRVVDADTHAPLADVKVISGEQARRQRTGMPPKGGELLLVTAPTRTDRDGQFAIETERVLTPFRAGRWFSVQLVFERAGYKSVRTNYSSLNLGTNASPAEPSLDAGEILLERASLP